MSYREATERAAKTKELQYGTVGPTKPNGNPSEFLESVYQAYRQYTDIELPNLA